MHFVTFNYEGLDAKPGVQMLDVKILVQITSLHIKVHVLVPVFSNLHG